MPEFVIERSGRSGKKRDWGIHLNLLIIEFWSKR